MNAHAASRGRDAVTSLAARGLLSTSQDCHGASITGKITLAGRRALAWAPVLHPRARVDRRGFGGCVPIRPSQVMPSVAIHSIAIPKVIHTAMTMLSPKFMDASPALPRIRSPWKRAAPKESSTR